MKSSANSVQVNKEKYFFKNAAQRAKRKKW